MCVCVCVCVYLCASVHVCVCVFVGAFAQRVDSIMISLVSSGSNTLFQKVAVLDCFLVGIILERSTCCP